MPYTRNIKMTYQNYYVYTWEDIEQAAVSIMSQMYKDEWRPDYIVGVTRGGLVLATILSHQVGCRLETLKVKLQDCVLGESCETNCWMSEDAFGYNDKNSGVTGARWDTKQRKNILIVNDNNDTGATFNWIKQDWEGSCYPGEESWNTVWKKNVRFAVMTENLSSSFGDVQYYWDEVNTAEKNVQLSYPYEIE